LPSIFYPYDLIRLSAVWDLRTRRWGVLASEPFFEFKIIKINPRGFGVLGFWGFLVYGGIELD